MAPPAQAPFACLGDRLPSPPLCSPSTAPPSQQMPVDFRGKGQIVPQDGAEPAEGLFGACSAQQECRGTSLSSLPSRAPSPVE